MLSSCRRLATGRTSVAVSYWRRCASGDAAATPEAEKKTAAVVLSGCGVFDGSEIHETVSLMHSLSKRGVEVECFAPDQAQMHVIDHIAGEEMAGEERNCLREAARIARGNVTPLADLDPSSHVALFLPGGFGAAKNLCNFATQGEKMTVDGAVQDAIDGFRSHKKPIGMCCIAPVIAAKCIPKARVTVGNDTSTVSVIESFGATHEEKGVEEVCVDKANLLVTTPAYMHGDAKLHEVAAGIDAMVGSVLAMAKE